MDHVNPVSLNPSLSPEGVLTHLLEFLESLHEIEQKPDAAVSVFQQVAPGSIKGGEPIKFFHQVQLLKILQKTKTELDELLEKMEGKTPSENATSPGDAKREPEVSHKEEGFTSSAKTLDRKAFEILLKKEKILSPFMATLEKDKKAAESVAALIKNGAENLEAEPKEARLASAFRTLAALLDARNVERIPTAELMQKMKPFLEHLIVVVETQENMSKPSQKLTQLVRHLSQSSSFLKELSWSSLFNADSSDPKKGAETFSKGGQIKMGKESSLEKAKNSQEGPACQSLFSAEGTKHDKPCVSFESLKEPSFEQAEELMQRPAAKEISPWAAPYSGQKLESRSRFKDKKKEKGLFRRKEKEDPEADRS